MNAAFFQKNRQKLFRELEPGQGVLLFSGKAPKKSADEAYPYTPNRNYYYLTGIDEAGNAVYLEKTAEGEEMSVLFIHPYDEFTAKWLGETIGDEEAREVSGIEDIRYINDLDHYVHGRIGKGVLQWGFDLEKDSFEAELEEGGRYAKNLREKYPQISIFNVYPNLSLHRQVKEKEEVEEIKKAIDITAEGIKNLWRNAKSNVMEYELEADFDYVLKKRGVKDYAFKTICAAGKNAAVLHYSANDSKVEPGSLVLLDLGAQTNYYNGDISRTFPVDGKFSDRQRQLYDIVIKAMDAVFAAIKPGVPFTRLNEIVKEVYAKELKEIGLIQSPEEVFTYYFHGVSHHLGLDTHDVGPRDNLLKEGMVLTVEPGLYLADEGIGIRVEDDVLVTADGMENLVQNLPRTADEVEAFLADHTLK